MDWEALGGGGGRPGRLPLVRQELREPVGGVGADAVEDVPEVRERLHVIMGDPAVFSLSRQFPPVSEAEASFHGCLSPSRRAPLPAWLPALS